MTRNQILIMFIIYSFSSVLTYSLGKNLISPSEPHWDDWLMINAIATLLAIITVFYFLRKKPEKKLDKGIGELIVYLIIPVAIINILGYLPDYPKNNPLSYLTILIQWTAITTAIPLVVIGIGLILIGILVVFALIFHLLIKAGNVLCRKGKKEMKKD
jgi:amino acid transporter